MVFQILKYDVVDDLAISRREISPAPKPLAPISLLEFRELAATVKAGLCSVKEVALVIVSKTVRAV